MGNGWHCNGKDCVNGDACVCECEMCLKERGLIPWAGSESEKPLDGETLHLTGGGEFGDTCAAVSMKVDVYVCSRGHRSTSRWSLVAGATHHTACIYCVGEWLESQFPVHVEQVEMGVHVEVSEGMRVKFPEATR